jgi:hypothetical protein
VHAEDIRRPLGITHTYPVAALSRVAAFYRGSNLLIGGKNRVAGLTLHATDTDWTAGTGPHVNGPILALVHATTGRAAALDHLDARALRRSASASTPTVVEPLEIEHAVAQHQRDTAPPPKHHPAPHGPRLSQCPDPRPTPVLVAGRSGCRGWRIPAIGDTRRLTGSASVTRNC